MLRIEKITKEICVFSRLCVCVIWHGHYQGDRLKVSKCVVILDFPSPAQPAGFPLEKRILYGVAEPLVGFRGDALLAFWGCFYSQSPDGVKHV